MRAREATPINGTDHLYVPEIDSFSFSEDVLEWKPGERVVFRPFRFPVRASLTGAGGVALLVGLISYLAGGTVLSFLAGGAVGGLIMFRIIRGPKRLFVLDWPSRSLEIRKGWSTRKVPFDDLVAVRVTPLEDEPIHKLDPMRYKSILELMTADEAIELLHANLPEKHPIGAGEKLGPSARWLSVMLELPIELAELSPKAKKATAKSTTTQAAAPQTEGDKPTNLAEFLSPGKKKERPADGIVVGDWGIAEWKPGKSIRFQHAANTWGVIQTAGATFAISLIACFIFGNILRGTLLPFSDRMHVWGSFAIAAGIAALAAWRAFVPRRDYLLDFVQRTLIVHRGRQVTERPFDEFQELCLRGLHTPSMVTRTKNRQVWHPGTWQSWIELVLADGEVLRLCEGTSFKQPNEDVLMGHEAHEELLPLVTNLAEEMNKDWRWAGFERHGAYRTRAEEAAAAPSAPELAAGRHLADGKLALIRAKYAGQQGSEDTSQYVRDAIAEFSKAHHADPNCVQGLMEIAKICEERDDRDNANAVYSKVLEIDPTRADVYSRRGFNHELNDRYDEAIADYTEAIRLEPKEEEHWRHRGEVYSEAERYDEAIADFTRFIELTETLDGSRLLDSLRRSRRSSIFADRAFAHWKKGDFPQGHADVQEALALDPDNAYAKEVETILRHAAS